MTRKLIELNTNEDGIILNEDIIAILLAVHMAVRILFQLYFGSLFPYASHKNGTAGVDTVSTDLLQTLASILLFIFLHS